jgi:mono/diheme cytochrome c family protein
MNLINIAIRKLETRLVRKLERHVASASDSHANTNRGWVAGAMMSTLLATAAINPMLARAADTNLYTEAQAQNGKRLYTEHCAGCHGANLEGSAKFPALAGPAFLERCQDNGHTADDLLFIMRSFMPYNEPGKLSKQQYADIMAYILKVNGIAADAKALTADAKTLQKILLTMNP